YGSLGSYGIGWPGSYPLIDGKSFARTCEGCFPPCAHEPRLIAHTPRRTPKPALESHPPCKIFDIISILRIILNDTAGHGVRDIFHRPGCGHTFFSLSMAGLMLLDPSW